MKNEKGHGHLVAKKTVGQREVEKKWEKKRQKSKLNNRGGGENCGFCRMHAQGDKNKRR